MSQGTRRTVSSYSETKQLPCHGDPSPSPLHYPCMESPAMGTLTEDLITSSLRLFSLGYSILAVAGMLDVPLEALERLYSGCVEGTAA